MGKMLVFTNAVEGRDDEYNEWYDGVHLTEVLALPEFVGATRHKLADAQMFPDQSHGYLAIYEYKGDAADAIAALGAAADSFNMSEALAPDAAVVLFDDR
jgi:hypothetical protein